MVRLVIAGLLAIGSMACASSGAAPNPFPRPGANTPAPARSPMASAASSPVSYSAIVDTALSLRGVPYRNGGVDRSGFDCSGLVAYVFLQQGLLLPRTATEQFAVGDRVDVDALQPGDLVFFSTIAPGPSHVGIVVSPGQFLHAPSSSGVVRVEPLSAPYWSSRYLGARRIR